MVPAEAAIDGIAPYTAHVPSATAEIPLLLLLLLLLLHLLLLLLLLLIPLLSPSS